MSLTEKRLEPNKKQTLSKPNSTMIQNLFLDHIAHRLKNGELRCILYLFRRINGFHKDGDFVALSQFEDGIMVNGHKMDSGTGLTRKAIRDSLKSLISRKLIQRVAWCHKCKKKVKNQCDCRADKMLGHYFTIVLENHDPVLGVTNYPPKDLGVTSFPDSGLLTSTNGGYLVSPQKKQKPRETKKKTLSPFPHPEFSGALERWQKLTGQEKTPTRNLQKLYFGCIAVYGQEKVETALLSYGESKWHKENKAWVLEKVLASRRGEIDRWVNEYKDRGSDIRRRSRATDETLNRYDRKRPEGSEAGKVTSAFKNLGKAETR